jgi:hypothetical protein
MMKIIVPLSVQAVPADLTGANEARIVGGAFRKEKNLTIEFFCSLLHGFGEFFEKGIGRVIQDRVDRIQTEAVEMELGDPVKRVVNEETPYGIAFRTINGFS